LGNALLQGSVVRSEEQRNNTSKVSSQVFENLLRYKIEACFLKIVSSKS
jgi:hypothetical protein